MTRYFLRNKPAQAALALLLSSFLLLTAAFAWGSFSQSKTNVFAELVSPNVNLHDDFVNGPNKDVYVENSGNRPVYLRIRLGEYLQTSGRGSLVQGQVWEESMAHLWAPHNGSPAANQCTLSDGNQTTPEWSGKSFHDYYTWLMGGKSTPLGQVYYRPATPEQRGETAIDGSVLQEPVVVCDENTTVEPYHDAHLLYAEQVKALTDTGKTETEALAELGLQKTQTASVLTMTEWLDGKGTPADDDYRAPKAKGNYWVIDTDGWAYWASPLAGGSATGLLLDKVERTNQSFESTADYGIHVWLQAVDKEDLGKLEATGNGGMTENGKKLILLVAGNLILDENGDEYIDNGDGSFEPKNPAPDEASATFVPLVTPTVDIPVEHRLHIGQRFVVRELVWSGDDYANWEDVAGMEAPYYNLLPIADAETEASLQAGTAVYQTVGSEKGWDENTYLIVAPIKADKSGEYFPDMVESCYLTSLQAVADNQGRAATLPTSYRKVYLGNGPYAFAWQKEGGLIGLPGDMVENPDSSIGGRFFGELGAGVYIEVLEQGATTSIHDPIRYFLPGRAVTKTVIDSIAGDGDDKVNNLFPLQLAVGDSFAVTTQVDANGSTTITDYQTGEGHSDYRIEALTLGRDNRYYLKLDGANGYIGPGADGYLGTGDDLRKWHGANGKIGDADDGVMNDNMVMTSEKKYFKDMGNGLYQQYTDATGALLQGTSVTYIAGKTTAPRGVSGKSVNDTFAYPALTLGSSKFDITFRVDTAKGRVFLDKFIPAGGGAETFHVQTNSSSANWWIKLNDTYLAPGADNQLLTADDIRVFKGPDGTLNTADDYMGDFTEAFLAGKSASELGIGATFTVDGMEWVVIRDRDGSGNRLITITKGISNSFMEMEIDSQLTTFNANSIPTLKKYGMTPTTPLETDAWTATLNQAVALSGYTGAEVGTSTAPAFLLSQSDYLTLFKEAKLVPYKTLDERWWLRSKQSAYESIYCKTDGSLGYEYVPSGMPGMSVAPQCKLRPAIFVKFSK